MGAKICPSLIELANNHLFLECSNLVGFSKLPVFSEGTAGKHVSRATQARRNPVSASHQSDPRRVTWPPRLSALCTAQRMTDSACPRAGTRTRRTSRRKDSALSLTHLCGIFYYYSFFIVVLILLFYFIESLGHFIQFFSFKNRSIWSQKFSRVNTALLRPSQPTLFPVCDHTSAWSKTHLKTFTFHTVNFF